MFPYLEFRKYHSLNRVQRMIQPEPEYDSAWAMRDHSVHSIKGKLMCLCKCVYLNLFSLCQNGFRETDLFVTLYDNFG